MSEGLISLVGDLTKPIHIKNFLTCFQPVQLLVQWLREALRMIFVVILTHTFIGQIHNAEVNKSLDNSPSSAQCYTLRIPCSLVHYCQNVLVAPISCRLDGSHQIHSYTPEWFINHRYSSEWYRSLASLQWRTLAPVAWTTMSFHIGPNTGPVKHT